MSIKNDQFLKDLQPYAKVTVVPGVTVGDLNFVSAQSVFSTTYIAPTLGTANLFAANREGDLFQSAIGDGGQGLAAGQTMTRGQTNWVDSAGRLPANECFVGIRCLFSVYKHANAASTGTALTGVINGAGAADVLIPNVSATQQILEAFSWQYQIGDGIIRNCGALGGYPQGGGVWSVGPAFALPAAAAPQYATGAQNGFPSVTDATRDLPIPFMFLPNISTRVKVLSGSAVLLDATGALDTFTLSNGVAAEYLAVRCTFQGYKLTMPV